jgi:secreted Zn-dependent insulinase-like peptidase
MYSSNIQNEYYIYQKVQSELPCNEIIKHINEFNDNLIENIKKIDLTKWKETVTHHLNKKENNTDELFDKYYSEIVDRKYMFDRNKLLLAYIDKISIESLCNFISNYILKNNKINIIQITS